jgi:hypothetical protein
MSSTLTGTVADDLQSKTDLSPLNASIDGVRVAMASILAEQETLGNWQQRFETEQQELQQLTSLFHINDLPALEALSPSIHAHVINELEQAGLVLRNTETANGSPARPMEILQSEQAQFLLNSLASEITRAVLHPHDQEVRHLIPAVQTLSSQISRFYVEVVSGESGVNRNEVAHAFSLGTILPFALRMTETDSLTLAETVHLVLAEGKQLLSDLDSGLEFLNLENVRMPERQRPPVAVRRALQAFRVHFEAKRAHDHNALEDAPHADLSRSKRNLQSTLYDLASYKSSVRRHAARLFRDDPALSKADVNSFLADYRKGIGSACSEERARRVKIFKKLGLPSEREESAIAKSYDVAIPFSVLRRRVTALTNSQLPDGAVAILTEEMTFIRVSHRKVNKLLANIERKWGKIEDIAKPNSEKLLQANPELLFMRSEELEAYLGKLKAALSPGNAVAALTGCSLESYPEAFSTHELLKNLLEEVVPAAIRDERSRTYTTLTRHGLHDNFAETGIHQLERHPDFRTLLPHFSSRIDRIFTAIQGHSEIGEAILTHNWSLLTLAEEQFSEYCKLLEHRYLNNIPQLGSGTSKDLSKDTDPLRTLAGLKQYAEESATRESLPEEKAVDIDPEEKHRDTLERSGWNASVVMMIVRDGFFGHRFIGDKVIQVKHMKNNTRTKNQDKFQELDAHLESTLSALVTAGAVERGNFAGTMSLTAHLGNVEDKALRDYLDFARTRE